MNTPTQINAQATQAMVASLLVPIQNKSLLVPNVVIAEVVGLQSLQSVEGKPPWMQGYIAWRGEYVPVISFEVANSQVHGRNSDNARIAVCNAVSGQSTYKFFAMIVQGIPRMVKLTEAEVREDKQALVGEAEEMAVITQLGKAIIPNLSHLESLLTRL